MTRRINQKLEAKRKREELEVAKAAKKARKKLDDTNVTVKSEKLIVDKLVGDHDEAKQAHLLLGTGNETVVDEFFNAGGKASHVLHILDTNQAKNKANEVAVVFHTVEALLLRAAQENSGRKSLMTQVALGIIKRVLEDYAKEITLLLSGTNTAYQAKAVLRMLTAMVSMGSEAASQVLARVNWESDNWETLPKRSSREDHPDVRTCFIHFMLSFLFDTSPQVLKEFLEKPRLPTIFVAMTHDPVETVQLIIETLRVRLLENPLVKKTSKMKVFSQQNLKTFLTILNWRGPKKSEENENVENEEDKKVIVNCASSFLCVLLGSYKFGVVFPDPEVGCGDKSSLVNPLTRQVLNKLLRPWENPDLTPIIVALLTSCPGDSPTLINQIIEVGEARDSAVWYQTADLLDAIFSTALRLQKAPINQSPHLLRSIVTKILFPKKLIKLLSTGVNESECATVRGRCFKLLVLMSDNIRHFKQQLSKDGKAAVVSVCKENITSFPRIQQIVWRWTEALETSLPVESKTALNCLQLLTFHIEHNNDNTQSKLQIENILRQVDEHRDSLGVNAADIQLEALRLFQTIMNSNNSSNNNSSLVKSLCKHDTLKLLLTGIFSEQSDQRQSCVRILLSLVKSVGLCLSSADDASLLFGLLAQEEISFVTSCLVTAVEKKEELLNEVQCLHLIKVPQEKSAVDGMIQCLMDPDFECDNVKDFIIPEDFTELFSPLILVLIKNFKKNPAFIKKYVSYLASLMDDRETFLSLVKAASNKTFKVDKSFNMAVSDLTDEELIQSPWVIVKTHVCQLLRLAPGNKEHEERLMSFLERVPEESRKRLVKMILTKQSLIKEFDPYLTADYNPTNNTVIHNNPSLLLLKIIKLAKQLGISCTSLKDQFIKSTHAIFDSNRFATEAGETIQKCFVAFSFDSDELHLLLQKLLEFPVTEFSTSFPVTDIFSKNKRNTVLGHILTGLCVALANLGDDALKIPSLNVLVQKLGCLLEVLLDAENPNSEISNLILNVEQLVLGVPTLIEHFSPNLTVVCLKNKSKEHLQLSGTLINMSTKHMDAFKNWVFEDKHRVTKEFWTLIPVVFGKDGVQHEKKLVTIIIKTVAKDVEQALSCKEKNASHNNLLQLVKYLVPFSKTEKQLEQWTKCLGPRLESTESVLIPDILLLKWTIISTIHRVQGGQDSRIMKEAFFPLMNCITTTLKSSKDSEHDESHIEDMCNAAIDCKSAVENKIFAKEMAKSNQVWELFYRSVLRYSLRLKHVGCFPINLLIDILNFLVSGGKLTNAKEIAEMVQSHSLYVEVILGPNCDLKTALVRLLCTLAPASLKIEQVPVLLSAYSATLHPSDVAILNLLQLYESNGIELNPYQPLIWGPKAIDHYKSTSTEAWKCPLATELLSMLDRDKLQSTSLQFPLYLSSENICENKLNEESWHLYDPRFLLPWLSYLCREIYLDRHIYLLESGVLQLCLSLTSSSCIQLRSEAFHLLHQFFNVMSSAKLAKEKQIWIHLLTIVRQSMSERQRNYRLPCLISVYLSRVVDVLLKPNHVLYKAINKALLAKPMIDMSMVPEFQRLFYSGERDEQLWILNLLKDGVRDNVDYRLLNKTFVSKLLLSQFGGCLADKVVNKAVLEVIESMVNTNYGCMDLVTKHGLLTWLLTILQDEQAIDKSNQNIIIKIVDKIAERLKKLDEKKDENMEEVEGERWETLMQQINLELKLVLTCLESQLSESSIDELSIISRLQKCYVT